MKARPLRPYLPDENVVKVKCPSCGAERGKECRTHGSGRFRRPHAERVRAYRQELRARRALERARQAELFA